MEDGHVVERFERQVLSMLLHNTLLLFNAFLPPVTVMNEKVASPCGGHTTGVLTAKKCTNQQPSNFIIVQCTAFIASNVSAGIFSNECLMRS